MRGGCEIAVQKLQGWCTEVKDGDGVLEPRRALLKLDFKNAFNSRRRDGVLREVFAHASLRDAYRLSDWAYSSPSPLLLMKGPGSVGTV